jgi:hypothetical protein
MPAIVTSLIFYMQIRVEKKYKAFAYRNYRHFTKQCRQQMYAPWALDTKYYFFPLEGSIQK